MRHGGDSTWLRVASGGLTLAGLLVSAPAHGRELERVSIVYEASGACQSDADFLSMVRSHTADWDLVPESTEAVRTFRVRVEGEPSGTTGTLAVQSASGAISEREIAGPNCAAVTEALAVMVAVAIELHAEAPAEHETGAAEDRSTDRPAPKRVARSAPSMTPRSSRRLRISLDARSEATSAVIEGVLFTLAMSMKLELPEEAGPQWLRGIRPSIGIGLRQSLPKARALRGGSVAFLWSTGHLRICPLRIAFGTVAEVSPCLEGNVGRLGAASEGYGGARSIERLWLDVGGSMSAGVNLSPRLFLSSTVLVTAPLMRREFTLASGASISSAPLVGVLGGLGIGVRL